MPAPNETPLLPMRLLILTDRFPPQDRGGAERIAYYQAKSFQEAGWEVGVVTGVHHDRRLETYEDGGLVRFPGYTFPRTGAGERLQTAIGAVYNPTAISAVKHAVASFKPNVIHAHMVSAISLAAVTQFSKEYPTIITFHGYQFECPKGGLYRKRGEVCATKPALCRLYSLYNRQMLSQVHRIVAISRFIETRLIEAGFDKNRVIYLPNGVPGLEDRRVEQLPSSHSILYVGRLSQNKGVAGLIGAFRTLADDSATLTIIGDDPGRSQLETLATGDSRIRFTGWLSHEAVQEYYRASRVVVVPSLWHEVMNTVICEAQSWARVVIASDIGGNRDLIEDNVSGILYPPGDQLALASALSRLFEDEAEAQRLASNGHDHVKQFSMSRHQAALLSLYGGALNEFQ